MRTIGDGNGAVGRRQFTVEAALAMLSGVAITIACGSGSGPQSPTAVGTPTPSPTPTPTPTPEPTPTPTPEATPTPAPTPTPASDKVGTISSNHGHAARITGAQLTAGGALQLDITGTASHPHTVSLTAAEVHDIAENHTVSKQSSTSAGHEHTVTFN